MQLGMLQHVYSQMIQRLYNAVYDSTFRRNRQIIEVKIAGHTPKNWYMSSNSDLDICVLQVTSTRRARTV